TLRRRTLNWFSLELGDGVEAFAPTRKMQDAFMAAFKTQGVGEMALFSRYDTRANVVTAYFSPAAKLLAESFGAKPCEKPSITGLGLLAGDARCWEWFFPGERPSLR
ncbi:MAG: hypothetical protein ACREDP_15870, partial [Bradyrhizobium sp.]